MEDGNVAAAESEAAMTSAERSKERDWLDEDDLELSLGLPSSRPTLPNPKSFSLNTGDDDSSHNCSENIEFCAGGSAGGGGKVLEFQELLDPQTKREAQALRRKEARKKRDEKRKSSRFTTTTNNNGFYCLNNSAAVNGNCVVPMENDGGSVRTENAGSVSGCGGGTVVDGGAVAEAAAAAAGWYEKQRGVDREIRERENYDGMNSCRKGRNNNNDSNNNNSNNNVVGFEVSQDLNSNSNLPSSSDAAVANGCVNPQVENDGGGGRLSPPSYVMPVWGSNAGLVDCDDNKADGFSTNRRQRNGVGVRVDAAVVGSDGGGGGFRPYHADRNSAQLEKKWIKKANNNAEESSNKDTLSNYSRDSSGISDHHCTSGGGQGQGGSSSSDARSHSSHAPEPLHPSSPPPLLVINNSATTSNNQITLTCPSPQNPTKQDGFLGGSLFSCSSSSSLHPALESTQNNRNKISNLTTCETPILPQQTAATVAPMMRPVETPMVPKNQQRLSPDKKPIMTSTQEPTSPLSQPKGDGTATTAAATSKPPKPPTGQNPQNALFVSQMPCVTTTGNGPNGKTITGILYRYTAKTEVSIVCVCHGISFSPAGFVEHAGGVDITHPLRHITVMPSIVL